MERCHEISPLWNRFSRSLVFKQLILKGINFEAWNIHHLLCYITLFCSVTGKKIHSRVLDRVSPCLVDSNGIFTAIRRSNPIRSSLMLMLLKKDQLQRCGGTCSEAGRWMLHWKCLVSKVGWWQGLVSLGNHVLSWCVVLSAPPWWVWVSGKTSPSFS